MPTEPPAVTIRFAGPSDATALARMRTDLARSHLDEAPPPDDVAAAYRARSEAFFAERLGRSPEVVAWVAQCEGVTIGSTVMLLQLSLPRRDSADSAAGVPLDARIRSVFVEPAYRRRGIARALITTAIGHAREFGCYRISLGSSLMAVPMYESLGFEPAKREMHLKL